MLEMLDEYGTKVQFKFDMGLNELGKTVIASKTYDLVKRDFKDYSALKELGELIAEVIDCNKLDGAYLITVDYIM